jgi:hypothetical protein
MRGERGRAAGSGRLGAEMFCLVFYLTSRWVVNPPPQGGNSASLTAETAIFAAKR